VLDPLVERIFSFFEWMGIDVIYATTVGLAVIMFSYKDEIENWGETRSTAKVLIISTALATLAACTISILRLVGVIDL